MDPSLSMLVSTAYTVEQKSLDVLKEQLEKTGNHEVQRQLRAHIVETQWQIKLLKACLEHHKVETRQDASAGMLADNAGRLGLFSFKRFEIALYKKLLVLAREKQAVDVAQACKEIIEQERAMAEWLEDNAFKVNPFLRPDAEMSVNGT